MGLSPESTAESSRPIATESSPARRCSSRSRILRVGRAPAVLPEARGRLHLSLTCGQRVSRHRRGSRLTARDGGCRVCSACWCCSPLGVSTKRSWTTARRPDRSRARVGPRADPRRYAPQRPPPSIPAARDRPAAADRGIRWVRFRGQRPLRGRFCGRALRVWRCAPATGWAERSLRAPRAPRVTTARSAGSRGAAPPRTRERSRRVRERVADRAHRAVCHPADGDGDLELHRDRRAELDALTRRSSASGSPRSACVAPTTARSRSAEVEP